MLSKEKQNCECLLLAAAAKFLGLDLRCVTSPYTSLHSVDCPSTALSCFCVGSQKGNFLKSSFSFDRFRERLKPLNYHIVHFSNRSTKKCCTKTKDQFLSNCITRLHLKVKMLKQAILLSSYNSLSCD